jgi:DNA (cytosine-5)-methyltransferase 1
LQIASTGRGRDVGKPARAAGVRTYKTPGRCGTALDYFAGSGLVGEGLKPFFRVAWANDVCEKKAATYLANQDPRTFHLACIQEVSGRGLPRAVLSWASFPCQDVSLAGNLEGIESTRSGLVWQWLRVMDEMTERPPILVAENVVGLLSAANGLYYRMLHEELGRRGYRVGAVVLDAMAWVPQSRPRVFVVAVNPQVDTRDLEATSATWCHPRPAVRAANSVQNWVWWQLPEPSPRRKTLEGVVDFRAACDDEIKRKHNLSLIAPRHRMILDNGAAARMSVFPGYKRTRNGRQVLELRFDGLAGCLRTPQGGSSRQVLVLRRNGRFETRLLTVREAANLMGVRSSYRIQGSYNDGYKAMGDAVAVPAVRHLTRHLLAPLAARWAQCRRRSKNA